MKNNKVGIITFHWATNYGAILQAFALQRFLELNDYNVKIINYKPRKYDLSFIKCFNSRSLHTLKSKLKNLSKERKLTAFRNKYLNLTNRYSSVAEIDCLDYNYYISGSDQVWNTYFTLHGEKNNSKDICSAYYLSFAPITSKKIGYAISLGTTSYPQKILDRIIPFVQKFNLLTFRENSGVDTFNQIPGLANYLVCDPTLLLINHISEYKFLLDSSEISNDVFVYILRDKLSIVKAIINKRFSDNKIVFSSNESITEWLSLIKNSKTIITNSYHGMIFSILFNREFYVLLDSNNSMNDRFYTLLDYLGLKERIVFNNNPESLTDKLIDWDTINRKLSEFVNTSSNVLLNSLRIK